MLKNKWMNNKGNAMLIVIILMSVLLMLSSVVFGYALREHRFDREKKKLLIGELQANTALSDTIEEIINRLDNDEAIGAFTVSRSNLNGDSDIEYEVLIYEDGEYDSDDYVLTTNRKKYYYQRTINEDLADGNGNGNSNGNGNGVVKAEDYDVFDPDSTKILYPKGVIIEYEGNYYQVVKNFVYKGDLNEVPGFDPKYWKSYEDETNIAVENIALIITTDNDGYPFEEKYIIDINSDNTDYYTVEVNKAY